MCVDSSQARLANRKPRLASRCAAGRTFQVFEWRRISRQAERNNVCQSSRYPPLTPAVKVVFYGNLLLGRYTIAMLACDLSKKLLIISCFCTYGGFTSLLPVASPHGTRIHVYGYVKRFRETGLRNWGWYLCSDGRILCRWVIVFNFGRGWAIASVLEIEYLKIVGIAFVFVLLALLESFVTFGTSYWTHNMIYMPSLFYNRIRRYLLNNQIPRF